MVLVVSVVSMVLVVLVVSVYLVVSIVMASKEKNKPPAKLPAKRKLESDEDPDVEELTPVKCRKNSITALEPPELARSALFFVYLRYPLIPIDCYQTHWLRHHCQCARLPIVRKYANIPTARKCTKMLTARTCIKMPTARNNPPYLPVRLLRSSETRMEILTLLLPLLYPPTKKSKRFLQDTFFIG